MTSAKFSVIWTPPSPCLHLVLIYSIPGFRVKEGLSCVFFRAIASQKTRNLALPWLENPVEFTQPSLLRLRFGYRPPPSQCGRHLWVLPLPPKEMDRKAFNLQPSPEGWHATLKSGGLIVWGSSLVVFCCFFAHFVWQSFQGYFGNKLFYPAGRTQQPIFPNEVNPCSHPPTLNWVLLSGCFSDLWSEIEISLLV